MLELVKDALSAPATLESMTSYADAFTASVRRHGSFEIDGLKFSRRPDIEIPTDYVTTGRHTMVYQLAGTEKLYRVIIEPIMETHGGKS